MASKKLETKPFQTVPDLGIFPKPKKTKFRYCRSIYWGPPGNKEKDIFKSPYYDTSEDAKTFGKQYVDKISSLCPHGRKNDWIDVS